MRSPRHSYTVYDPSYVYAPWKKRVALFVILALTASIIWFIAVHRDSSVDIQQKTETSDSKTSASTTITSEEPKDEPRSAPNKTYYPVAKVVDGDTLDVVIDGKTERLRLIGIDTPEVVDPRKTVQCFGVEASNKAKSLLAGKRVSLEQDTSQGERDKYGRLLAYVFLEDGVNFNEYMIAEGYAHEYTYRIPYKYQVEFKAAQSRARDSQKGLWATSTCNGQTS